MVDRSELVTREQIVAAAVADGLGSAEALGRRFYEYQGLGLVGKSTNRTARKGGEALWHPAQLELFVDLVRMREREQLRIPTLANFPVALWRLGTEGIETAQAQRAFRNWGGVLTGSPSDIGQPGRRRGGGSRSERRPRGDRSLRRQAVDAQVDLLAGQGANATVERALRDLIEMINDSGQTPSRKTFVTTMGQALAGGAEPTPVQKQEALNQYKAINVMLLVVRHLDLVCEEDSIPLWEWARRIDQSGWADYVQRQQTMAADPEVGHLYVRPLDFDLFQQACRGLMVILGIGLATQWHLFDFANPPGHEAPPKLAFEQRR
jgi:hypothetical protein